MNHAKIIELINQLERMKIPPTPENILMLGKFNDAAIKGYTFVQLTNTPPPELSNHGFRVKEKKVSFVTLPDVAWNTIGLYYLNLALTNRS